MELNVKQPQDVLPLMEEFKLPDGIPLYKVLKEFTVLEYFFTGEPRNILYILAYKEEESPTFRLVRYFKNVADAGIDEEFSAENVKDAGRKIFRAMSKHII
ncbi:hypothetical protein [Persephonella sp.]